jgi:hypothetical protein
MWMKIEDLARAFENQRLTFPPGAGQDVVEFEVVDRDGMARRILWMEGRDYDIARIAQGGGPARNPVADDQFQWPSRYVEHLREALHGAQGSLAPGPGRVGITSPIAIVVEFGMNTPTAEVREAFENMLDSARARQRQLGGTPRQRGQRLDFRIERAALFFWLRGTSRWDGPFSYRKIAEKWLELTSDWTESLALQPDEWPDSLRQHPQALPAYEEWRALEHPDVELLDERSIRETASEVISPIVRGDTSSH